MLNALRDNNDNFEAVIDKHAIDVLSLIQQEHERAQNQAAREAQTTRALNAAEHQVTRAKNVVEHVTTRAEIKHDGAEAVAMITTCVQQSADSQVKAQEKIEAALSSEAANIIQALADEMELQHFSTELQILDVKNTVIRSPSHQLPHTNQQISQIGP